MNLILKAIQARLLGERGEREALRFLRKRGMKLLRKGYRTALGEVDLIVRDGPVVVFVEVKTRKRGTPAEAVTPDKQRKLTLAALHFLKRHRLMEVPSRFDVVAIVWPEGRQRPDIEHFPNAFQAVGRGQFFR